MLPLMTFIGVANELREAVVQHFVAPVQSQSIDSGLVACKHRSAAIGVFLTLSEPSRPMITEAAGAGLYEVPGYAGSVPRIQIVTIEQAMALRDRAVKLPALRQGSFKRAARKEDTTSQGRLDL